MYKRYEEILVSVIMPTFNTEEKYLRKAIESILNQTHSNLEYIITIDGSQNQDLNIVSEYADRDNRIKIIDNYVNKGLVYSLNNMIASCTGKYIVRMDSDDISYPKRIEEIIAFMEKNSYVGICGSQVKYLYGNKKSRRSFLPCTDKDMKYLLAVSNPFAHPTVAFRKSIFVENNLSYNDKEKSEDFNMWVDCAKQEVRFANINRPLLLYRIHDKQTISIYKQELTESGMRIREKYINYLGGTLNKDEIQNLCKFAQSNPELRAEHYVKVSELLMQIADLFDDPNSAKEFYSQLFMKKIFMARKHYSLKVKHEYRNMTILNYCKGHKMIWKFIYLYL